MGLASKSRRGDRNLGQDGMYNASAISDGGSGGDRIPQYQQQHHQEDHEHSSLMTNKIDTKNHGNTSSSHKKKKDRMGGRKSKRRESHSKHSSNSLNSSKNGGSSNALAHDRESRTSPANTVSSLSGRGGSRGGRRSSKHGSSGLLQHDQQQLLQTQSNNSSSSKRHRSSKKSHSSSSAANNSLSSHHGIKDSNQIHNGNNQYDGRDRNSGTGTNNGAGALVTPPQCSMNIDPTMLARGMSSRYVGTIVSNRMQILSNDEVQKDLNLMTGYGNACTAYTQRYFVYRNPELVVNNTHYLGPSGAGSNVTSSDQKNGAGSSELQQQGTDAQKPHYPPWSVNAPYRSSNGARMITQGGNSNNENSEQASYRGGIMGGMGSSSSQPSIVGSSHHHLHHNTIMPVRIDPEEEKRVALLRQRIRSSEHKREILETEYLSLCSHYIHEQKTLEVCTTYYDGTNKFIKGLLDKKADLLALRRAALRMGLDVMECLENPSSGSADEGKDTEDATEDATDAETLNRSGDGKQKGLKRNPLDKKSSTNVKLKARAKSKSSNLSTSATIAMEVDEKTVTNKRHCSPEPKQNQQLKQYDQKYKRTHYGLKECNTLAETWQWLQNAIKATEAACRNVELPPELLELSLSAVSSDDHDNQVDNKSKRRSDHEDIDADDSNMNNEKEGIEQVSVKMEKYEKHAEQKNNQEILSKDNTTSINIYPNGKRKRDGIEKDNDMKETPITNGELHQQHHTSSKSGKKAKRRGSGDVSVSPKHSSSPLRSKAPNSPKKEIAIMANKTNAKKNLMNIIPNDNVHEEKDQQQSQPDYKKRNESNNINIKNEDSKTEDHGAKLKRKIPPIPWEANVQPVTPYGVPLLVSALSLLPDKSVGWGKGHCPNSLPDTDGFDDICWIDSAFPLYQKPSRISSFTTGTSTSNIPKSNSSTTQSSPSFLLPSCEQQMENERKELMTLQREVLALEMELEKERKANQHFHGEMNMRRKEGDSLCAAMAMIRSETEAVLTRSSQFACCHAAADNNNDADDASVSSLHSQHASTTTTQCNTTYTTSSGVK